MSQFMIACIALAIMIYLFAMTCIFGAIELIKEFRKWRNTQEWNAQKRKMEIAGKSEGDIRSAYFEFCKKLVKENKYLFGWGIPNIGHINVRRRTDDTETVAEQFRSE